MGQGLYYKNVKTPVNRIYKNVKQEEVISVSRGFPPVCRKRAGNGKCL